MAVIADLTVDTLQAAAQQLSPPTGYDIGDKLTCDEADALATIIALCGNGPTALALLTSHADNDSDLEEDRHQHLAGDETKIDAHLDSLI